MVRRLFRQVRRGLGGGGVIVVQRAAQIPFGFAAFFGKQDRRQQPPAQQPADQRHDPRAEAGLERRKPGPRAAQHLFPARDMLFFHARQVREDFGPLGVGLRRGDASIEEGGVALVSDRKSTRLNSSHSQISYAVFCLKKKKTSAHMPPPQICRSNYAELPGPSPLYQTTRTPFSCGTSSQADSSAFAAHIARPEYTDPH